MNPTFKQMSRLLSGALILICLVILSGRLYFRLDVTQNRSYTLSTATRELIRGADDIIRISWYRSAAFSAYAPAVGFIEAMLQEYSVQSFGGVIVDITDPVAAGIVDEIRAQGIISRQINLERNGRTELFDLYSGIIIEYQGRTLTIPFLIDSGSLEYDLNTKISVLLAPQAPSRDIVLIYGGTSVFSELYPYLIPWLEYAGFEVSISGPGSFDGNSAATVIVLGSATLTAADADALDVFMGRGGNALFLVSGNSVDTAGNWSATAATNRPVLELLAQRGVDIAPGLVMDISNYRITMPSLDGSRQELINYPFWVIPQRAPEALDLPLFAGFSAVQCFWPSELLADFLGNTAIPLLQSGPHSAVMNEPYDTDPFGTQLEYLAAKSEKKASVLAAYLPGKGKTIVIADEYLPSMMIDYCGADYNLDFVVSCVEWISGRENLLLLKNRKPPNYSLRLPDTEEEQLALLRRLRIINLILMPALPLCAAAILHWYRRKRP